MAYTTIDKPDDYFNTVLYTGTGSGGSNRQITGVGFQPDWVWVKTRGSAQEHVLSDVVRGATGALDSSATTAEEITNTRIGAFISDGFQLGSGSVQNRVNQSGIEIASWNWLANGTGVANTQGSIASTVSANTTSGFSIVSFTGNATAGATIGHGLGSAPSLILTKNRDFAYNWHLWTHAFSSYNDTIQLNTTAAIDTGTLLNNTAPTSSLITLGSSAVINASGEKIIAYVFAEKKGYSKFGSYIGNGNADGTFVYTGFKPAWIMIKRTDSTSSWSMRDTIRSPYNVVTNRLWADLTNVESTSTTETIDILSNGFKCRNNVAGINASGGTYIYMAFAENPFVTSTSIPTTAR
jgi:hypothetical protein